MPTLLAVNRNITIFGHLKWRGGGGLSSIFTQKLDNRALDEGEVKTKSKNSIGTNLHYEGSM